MILAISLSEYNNLMSTIDNLNSELIKRHNEINYKDYINNYLQGLNEYNKGLIQSLYSEIERQKSAITTKDLEIITRENEIKNLKKKLYRAKTKIKNNSLIDCFSNLARKRKSFFEVETRQVFYIKNELQLMFEKIDEICNGIDLKINRIEISKKNEEIRKGKIDIIIEENAKERLSMEFVLYIKDQYRISDAIFDKLVRYFNLEIPSIRDIKKKRESINNQFQLNKIDNGYFVDPLIQLKKKLNFLIKTQEIKEMFIQIKLTADGTNVSRSVKIINFCYSVINQGKKSAGVNGTYSLGIFQVEQENYESIKNWMSKIWGTLNSFDSFVCDGKNYKIEYFFCSDWKMSSIVLGLFSANSNFPCLWCEVHKQDLYKIENFTPRSFEKQKKIVLSESKKKNPHFGYKTDPIISEIPHSNYCIDLLHLFLRISDVLFELLISDLAVLDKLRFNSEFSEDKHQNLSKLFSFLKDKCGITVKIFKNETKSINLAMNSLTGINRNKIFERMKLKNLFESNLKNCDKIDEIWSKFYTIYTSLKKDTIPDADQIKLSTSEWLNLFLSIYQRNDVTPYIHAFTNHLHQFVSRNININHFNLEGLEKLNDFTTCDYFRATNKRKNSSEQILKKRCRIEYFEQNL
ncbi:unnamed protein product [Brachionus calyciflorus]|uniref:Uncharacterized protein n=1 Tax=Brachionus calyciflorus TaxID=104777 RepID=A0A814PA78_9BILA|nr:unnamed protein product [Brachionus calyciflorus]